MTPEQLDLLRRLHEDATALTDEELAELQAAIKAQAATVDKTKATADEIDLLIEAKENLDVVQGEQETRATEAAERQEQAAQLLAEIEGETPAPVEGETPPAEGEGGETAPVEGETPPVEGETPAPVEGETPAPVEGEQVSVAAGGTPVAPAPAGVPVGQHRPSIRHLAARRPAIAVPTPTATDSAVRQTLVASGDVPGLAGGAEVDLEQWAHGVARKFEAVRHSTMPGTEKIYLGGIRYEYPEDRMLRDNGFDDKAKIDAVTSPTAIAASGGVCGPVAVDYSLTAIAVADRPVKQSLVQFGADRGGLRYVLPHTLAMVTADGPATLWTEQTDVAPGASTKPHATYVCQTPLEAYVNAVTSIVQFGNFQARYFPEQIAEYMTEVEAVHSRLAEATILGQMLSGSTLVTADSYELGAVRDLLAVLDRAVSAMRYRHRLAPGTPLRFWVPAFLRDMLRADQARQIPGDSYSGAERLAISDAIIDSWFAVRNVNLTEYMDSPTGAAVFQGFPTQLAGQMSPWPLKTLTFLAPEGSWMFLDGGELNLGMVRDSTLNKTNDFQMFDETFELAVFRGHESQAITWSIDPSGLVAGTVATGTVETEGS